MLVLRKTNDSISLFRINFTTPYNLRIDKVVGFGVGELSNEQKCVLRSFVKEIPTDDTVYILNDFILTVELKKMNMKVKHFKTPKCKKLALTRVTKHVTISVSDIVTDEIGGEGISEIITPIIEKRLDLRNLVR